MSFCRVCGAEVGTSAFCTRCGVAVASTGPPQPASPTSEQSAYPQPFYPAAYPQPLPPAYQPPTPPAARSSVVPIVLGCVVGAAVLAGVVLVGVPRLLPVPATGSTTVVTRTVAVPASTTQLTSAPASPSATVAPITPASAGVPALGVYRSMLQQVGAGRVVNWATTVTFGGQGAAIVYNHQDGAFACSGTLTRLPSGAWLEHITSGGCDDGGSWVFSAVTPTSFHALYTPPTGRSYSVSGDFAVQG